MIVTCVAREEITVSNSAVGLTASNYNLTPTSGTAYTVRYAEVSIQGADIRTTIDGSTTPTTDIGRIMYDGSTYRIWGLKNIANFNMIRDGATDAEVVVEYFGAKGG